jgi:plastocyanin domain-containing protein
MTQRPEILVAFALTIFACSKSEPGTTSSTTAIASGSSGELSRVVKIAVDENGFEPSSVTLPKGGNTMLMFTRTTDTTCADKVVFPEIGISKDLPLNTPVSISVPTDEARKLTFQCGMGMYKSKVVVQ